ncbi:MAG: hypothetical protein WDZ28_00750 [Simkaniaceae bacterium]
MSLGNIRTQYYFVNGVANTNKSGKNHTDKIKKILQKSLRFDPNSISIKFHHNYSTPVDSIIIDVLFGIIGLITVVYFFYKERKGEGNINSRILGALGAIFTIAALWDYNLIQKEKNQIARDLVESVSRFLDKNKLNTANLILHSQGADIGYRALFLLNSYKHRIKTLTLGAMVTIPDDFCLRVTNYKFSNDLVSEAAAGIFEGAASINDGMARRKIIYLKGKGMNTHGVKEYLEESSVKNALLDTLSPLSFCF